VHRSLTFRGPAARLGTVSHAVLEAASKGAFDQVDPGHLSSRLEQVWDQHMTEQATEARASPLEQHFGPPSRWPYYAVKRAHTFRLARQLVGARSERATTAAVSAHATEQVEQSYEAFEGRLRGRVDHVVERSGRVEIEDYKSGAILEAQPGEAERMKEVYRRQLLLYAALYQHETGRWPHSAHLLSLSGERASIDIDPVEASSLASETVALLDAYNRAVASITDVWQLAQPSRSACSSCPYKAFCEPFWRLTDWSWVVATEAFLGGNVVSTQQYVGAGTVLEIEGYEGNLTPARYRLRGLSSARVPELDQIVPGVHLRLLGARIAKPDQPLDLLMTDYTQLWWRSSTS
jgi:hypothetical protein